MSGYDHTEYLAVKERRSLRVTFRETPDGLKLYYCGVDDWSTDRDAAIRYAYAPRTERSELA